MELTVKTPAIAEPIMSPPTKLGGSCPENCGDMIMF